MLLINCPFCGPRDEIEFRCGGESHIARPKPDCSDEVWAGYLYKRINPRGFHHERWLHAAGCGLWFNVARDTQTHVIHAVYPIDGAKPGIPR